MHIAQPLLFLLSFSVTHEAFAGERTFAHNRKKLARAVLTEFAEEHTPQRLKEKLAMEENNKRREALSAFLEPLYREVRDKNEKEAAAARAAADAHFCGSCGSVIISCNRNKEKAFSRL